MTTKQARRTARRRFKRALAKAPWKRSIVPIYTRHDGSVPHEHRMADAAYSARGWARRPEYSMPKEGK